MSNYTNSKVLIRIFLLVVMFGVGIYVWRVKNASFFTLANTTQYNSYDEENSTTVLVGKDEIEEFDIATELKLYQASVADTSPTPKVKNIPELREKLVSTILEQRLLMNYVRLTNIDPDFKTEANVKRCQDLWESQKEMEFAGLTLSAKEKKYVENRFCERTTVALYFEKVVFPKLQVSEVELRSYYDKHRSEFIQPRKALVRQIVFGTDEEAKKLLPSVNVKNFGEMARIHSVTPEASKGGLVEPFAQGTMPTFFDSVFSMQERQVFGVISSPYGHHILMVEKFYPRRELSFAEAREEVAKKVRDVRRAEEYSRWVTVAMNAVTVRTKSNL